MDTLRQYVRWDRADRVAEILAREKDKVDVTENDGVLIEAASGKLEMLAMFVRHHEQTRMSGDSNHLGYKLARSRLVSALRESNVSETMADVERHLGVLRSYLPPDDDADSRSGDFEGEPDDPGPLGTDEEQPRALTDSPLDRRRPRTSANGVPGTGFTESVWDTDPFDYITLRSDGYWQINTLEPDEHGMSFFEGRWTIVESAGRGLSLCFADRGDSDPGRLCPVVRLGNFRDLYQREIGIATRLPQDLASLMVDYLYLPTMQAKRVLLTAEPIPHLSSRMLVLTSVWDREHTSRAQKALLEMNIF